MLIVSQSGDIFLVSPALVGLAALVIVSQN